MTKKRQKNIRNCQALRTHRKSMCGRFALHTDQQTLAEYFDTQPLPDMLTPEPRFNIAPSMWHPVILASPPVGGEGTAPRHTRLMKWGLIPSWSNSDSKIKPINARSETASEKPMFKHLLDNKRCIVPANGWYEWSTGNGGKRPYWHHHLEGKPLALAGLWSSWSSTNGDAVESFTILTCQAHSNINHIHHRMPVLLSQENWQVWLDDSVSSTQASELIDTETVHSAAVEIDYYQVSTEVNKVANDNPQLIDQIYL
jgi:putative SOS response-associated peptidase YedK